MKPDWDAVPVLGAGMVMLAKRQDTGTFGFYPPDSLDAFPLGEECSNAMYENITSCPV